VDSIGHVAEYFVEAAVQCELYREKAHLSDATYCDV